MTNAILILGQSGSGKSTSLRNLNPETTFIINVLNKPLPFKGFTKNYKTLSKENPHGNYYSTDKWEKVTSIIDYVNEKMPHIKTLVVDDWQYILSYEFLNRSHERGFDKFTELALHGWSILNKCLTVRSDLTTFVLAHSDIDGLGQSRIKTIGKLLDEKIVLEGLYTVVLHARIVNGEYLLQTKSSEQYLAKTPLGMFNEDFIPNDLVHVKNVVENYYNDDEIPEPQLREEFNE